MKPRCACAECFFFFFFFRDTLLSTFFQQQLMEPCYSILYLYCTMIYCNKNNGCPDDALDIFCKPFAVNELSKSSARNIFSSATPEIQAGTSTNYDNVPCANRLLAPIAAWRDSTIIVYNYYHILLCTALFLVGFGWGMYYNIFVC